jgi:hypothetical protein
MSSEVRKSLPRLLELAKKEIKKMKEKSLSTL